MILYYYLYLAETKEVYVAPIDEKINDTDNVYIDTE